MAKFWCLHCQNLIVTGSKFSFNSSYWGDRKCPFCGAFGGDIFSVKKHRIKVPFGKKHGDNIGYPEKY